MKKQLARFEIKPEVINPDLVDKEKIAKAGINDKDLLYVRFKLCHVGANANLDGFEYDDLENNYETAIYKPINWEHKREQIIGTIYNARFVVEDEAKAEDFTPYVECDAVIYKYYFPVFAEEIKKRFEEGTLRFSMETWFESAKCSECGKEFVSASDYCDHLKNRYSVKATRYLKNITFGAAAVVKRPADKNAVGLTVGKVTMDDWQINDTITYVIKTFDDLEVIINEFINTRLDDELIDKDKLVQKLNDIFMKLGGNPVSADKKYTEDELRAAIEKAIAEHEEKSDVKEQLERLIAEKDAMEKEMEEKDKKAKEAEEEAKKAKEEMAKMDEKMKKEKAKAERISQLQEAGIEVNDDIEKVIDTLDDEAFASYKKSLENMVKASDGDNKVPDNAPNPDEEDKDVVKNISSVLAALFANNEE